MVTCILIRIVFAQTRFTTEAKVNLGLGYSYMSWLREPLINFNLQNETEKPHNRCNCDCCLFTLIIGIVLTVLHVYLIKLHAFEFFAISWLSLKQIKKLLRSFKFAGIKTEIIHLSKG